MTLLAGGGGRTCPKKRGLSCQHCPAGEHSPGRSLRRRGHQELPWGPSRQVVGRRLCEGVHRRLWKPRGSGVGRLWGWFHKGTGLSLAEEAAPSSRQSRGQEALRSRGGHGPRRARDPWQHGRRPHLPDAAQEGVGHEAVVLVASAARGHHQGQQGVGAGQRLQLPHAPQLLQGGGPRAPRALQGPQTGHLRIWKTGPCWRPR